MLIAAGASLLIEDHGNLSPRQLAIMAEDHELSEYLESQEEFQAEKLMAGGRQIHDYETPVWINQCDQNLSENHHQWHLDIIFDWPTCDEMLLKAAECVLLTFFLV